MTTCIRHGNLLPDDPVSRALADPAVQYSALGFFETMRVETVGGTARILCFDPHMRRLEGTLARWGIAPPPRQALVRAVTAELAGIGPQPLARLKIIVGRDPDPDPAVSPDAGLPSRTFVLALPVPAAAALPPALRLPISLDFHRDYAFHTTHPLAGFKNCHYWLHLTAAQRARARGFDDAILLNERGEIIETTVHNIFWIRDGSVRTPALECGPLPGTVRAALIDALRRDGTPVIETRAAPEELLRADSVFVTNSMVLMQDVARVGGTDFAPARGRAVVSRYFDDPALLARAAGSPECDLEITFDSDTLA